MEIYDIGSILVAIFVFALLVGGASYFLGKKKTSNPVLSGTIGFLLAFIAPLGLIYIAALIIKNDTKQQDQKEH